MITARYEIAETTKLEKPITTVKLEMVGVIKEKLRMVAM